MEIFEYDFMRRAFVVGILLSAVIPCIGMIVVLKRLSMVGDVLSHMSLAGVAGGLITGVNPVLSAVLACVAAAFCIEGFRRKIPQYAELSIAVMLSAGLGATGILSGFVKNASSFNNFLFGSIIAFSDFEMTLVICVSGAVMATFLMLYKELFYIAFNERAARLSGVPVQKINFIFTILTAVTVAVAARTAGALIVSSTMIIPVACAMQFGKSYKKTVIYAVYFAVIFTVTGLYISYYLRLKPGGTIALLGVFCFILILSFQKFLQKLRRKRTAK
ncbi:MAG: metal ABC transporter permease [Synergistaceae bacterium]|jgi:zinc transport system permease protein|nr:metal ABC transporter permease [Synergistaceae bacterium]